MAISLPSISDSDRTTGGNVFEGWLQFARATITPQFPPWALRLLIASAIWRVLIMITCLVMIMIPAFRGASSRKKHYFFIRRVFPEPRVKPFLVPNRSIVVPFCELVSSAIYLASALLNYQLYLGNKLFRGANITVWYGLAWLPSYLGIWMIGWSLTHACLYDPDSERSDSTTKKWPSRFLTPLVYNFLWISWSFIVIIITFLWAISAAQIQDVLEINYIYLFSLLEQASHSWTESPDLSKIPLKAILVSLNLTLEAAERLSLIVHRWAYTWLALAIGLAIFYILAVRYLLRILKRVVLMGDADGIGRGQLTSPIWSQLQEEFRFLLRSSALISLTIVCQIFLVIYQTMSSTHIAFVKWRIGSALLNQLPGIFMAPCLLYHSWRILMERQVADESDFYQARTNFNDSKSIPEMTSQLLGWDTTGFWKHHSDIEVVNFPGLHQLRQRNSMGGCGVGRRSRDFQLSAIPCVDIKVTRLTVVTEDIETT